LQGEVQGLREEGSAMHHWTKMNIFRLEYWFGLFTGAIVIWLLLGLHILPNVEIEEHLLPARTIHVYRAQPPVYLTENDTDNISHENLIPPNFLENRMRFDQ
jgi:hypothetical protein